MYKKIILGVLLGISSHLLGQQVVDLSTGVYNNTTSLIPYGTDDDTWQVKTPTNPVYTNVKCAWIANGSWSTDPNVTWVSPAVYTSGSAKITDAGNYSYKMTFTASTCTVSSALINLNKYGGDNTVTSISLNGYPSHLLGGDYNPLSSVTIPVTGEIIPGVNTIFVTVNNLGHYAGFLAYGNLTINYITDPNLVPSISGGSSFCSGQPLTFTGSDGTSIAANHYWQIEECTSTGGYVSGYSWIGWYAGAPGVYTFPISSSVPCNKYYKVTLGLQNCADWIPSTKIIFVGCTPIANAGSDQNICANSCTTIGTAAISGNSYQWSTIVGTSSVVVGNTAQPSVCPPRTPASTVYTVMVTNNISGCTATDQVTVSVEDNNPAFTLTSSYSLPNNYYTLVANPLITVQPAGSGVAWYVDEIVSPTNTTLVAGSDAYNPSCWWSPNSCNFNGYNGPLFNSSGSNPMTGGCGNPVVGRFTVNHAYRIIRGTWSSVCPWQQYSLIAYTVAGFTGGPIINIIEDTDAPDYSYLMTSSSSIESKSTDVKSYPNPSTGTITISSEAQSIQSVIVKDALGRIVKEIKNINSSKTEISLENENKGFYFVEITYEGQTKPVYKKIILE